MLTTIIGIGSAGIVLLFLEMFLPGLIAGIAGAILLLIAVIMAYSELGAEAGNIALIIAVLSSGALWWWWATQFQNTRFGKMMTLDSSVPGNSSATGLAELIGQTGTAVTPLKPGGTVVIAGRRVDALTDGTFLDPGTEVIVIGSNGPGVIVKRAGIESAK
jgi:membrane-bound serine protease (ClpP class)